MTSFIEHLTHQLQHWSIETSQIQPDAIQRMLQKAADAALSDIADVEADRVRVWREIEPDSLKPAISLEVRGDGLLLYPPELKWLKAVLLSYDEDAAPQVGEPLSVPVRMQDGTVISTVTPELLDSKHK